jgi:hypothetical protein
MLLRQRTPNRGAGSFRPTLEVLEDRTVPSLLGTFISGLNPANIIGNLTIQGQINKFDGDVAKFEKDPTNAALLVQLAVDAGQLQALSVQVNAWNASFIATAEQSIPFLDSADKQTARDQEDASNKIAVQITQAANDALDSVFAALFVFLSGGGQNLNLPTIPTGTSSSSSSPTPTGTFSENIDPPPATWPSDALTPPPCSVTVTNPTNTPLTVTVSYTDTLGNKTSSSDVCTNSTITVADGGAVCPPGNTGTFTVSVTGQPDQQFGVAFQ